MRRFIAGRELRKIRLRRWPVMLCALLAWCASKSTILTLIICLVVLHEALLSLARPAQVMNIAVEQVFLVILFVAFVALRPP